MAGNRRGRPRAHPEHGWPVSSSPAGDTRAALRSGSLPGFRGSPWRRHPLLSSRGREQSEPPLPSPHACHHQPFLPSSVPQRDQSQDVPPWPPPPMGPPAPQAGALGSRALPSVLLEAPGVPAGPTTVSPGYSHLRPREVAPAPGSKPEPAPLTTARPSPPWAPRAPPAGSGGSPPLPAAPLGVTLPAATLSFRSAFSPQKGRCRPHSVK